LWRNEGGHNYYSGNINFNNYEMPRLYPLSFLKKVDRRQGKALVSDEGRWKGSGLLCCRERKLVFELNFEFYIESTVLW
jgi:hypothetical protein